MNQARILKLDNILPLNQVVLGKDHIGFEFDRYEMDFRSYLHKVRKASELNDIFMGIISGIR
jgi:hypothetical protein